MERVEFTDTVVEIKPRLRQKLPKRLEGRNFGTSFLLELTHGIDNESSLQ